MNLLTKAPRGTADMLPDDSCKARYLEDLFVKTAELFGCREIRTPCFEHTELFNRSVGDTTDVVQKEMYTFNDNGGRSITLRPEGTAGVARAVIEHGLYSEPMPQKLFYSTSCYRYEKPQAGRMREFHQFGVECFGSALPLADAELISLAKTYFNAVGIKNLSLQINSIGCPECRPKYLAALREYFKGHSDELCETCRSRLEKNPMRILDCKSPICSGIAAGAPVILDYLCDECEEHFKGVQQYLDAMNIKYIINPKIVRGLDYYTRTVFEFVSNSIGAQGTVCGGGRYDGLIEELSGHSLPALGFGMGVERLRLVAEAENAELAKLPSCDVFIVCADDSARVRAALLTSAMRLQSIRAETDLCGRSLKAQMKYADKINSRFVIVLGQNELDSGTASLKSMQTGKSETYAIDDMPAAVIEKLGGEYTSCDTADSDCSADSHLRVLEGGKGKEDK